MMNATVFKDLGAVLVAALCAAAQAAPLALDTAALTNAWEEAGISAYKCRIAFRDFGKDVADANAEAAAKRTKLDTTARVYLKSQMEKAQAEGDLDRVLVFKGALESARGGAITGDDEAIVKLRESYDRQLALADKALLDAGLAAARSFAASLDEQKKEATKKGDLDDAQKIAAFQKKVGEWAKAVQGQATPAEVQRPPATPRPQPRPQPQPRQTIQKVKPVEPKATFGDLNSQKASYCVIDLSAGANALSYPVTYLAEPPSHGFNVDEYKTTKLVLKRIEAGSYKMGGSVNVTLTKHFFIGIFEVTQKQYELVMGSNPSYFKGNMRPVECISYNAIRGSENGSRWPASTMVDSESFLGRMRTKTGLNFDLPTEAQWEYACRAGSASNYNNGGNTADDLNLCGRYLDNQSDGNGGYSSRHTIVGCYLPNAWGLFDMHGNVLEWCLDWAGPLSSPQTDPVGAPAGKFRVQRGGSHADTLGGCSSSARYLNRNPDNAHNFAYGFRLARTITGLEQPTQFAGSDLLIHRWSFNGNLTDSVGGQNAKAVGNVTRGGRSYRLGGGRNGSSYIDLGPNILPRDGRSATLEIWATIHSPQKWSRVFDIGSGIDDFMFMSWCDGNPDHGSSPCMVNIAGVNGKYGHNVLGFVESNKEFHMAMVCSHEEDGSWLVTFYLQDAASGETLGKASVDTQGKDWSLMSQRMRNCWLGRSQWDSNLDANASYNEVRVWATALTEEQLTESARRGPDADIASKSLSRR